MGATVSHLRTGDPDLHRVSRRSLSRRSRGRTVLEATSCPDLRILRTRHGNVNVDTRDFYATQKTRRQARGRRRSFRTSSAALPRASPVYQIETGASGSAEGEEREKEREQPRERRVDLRRRKGDDRSRTASSVLTGAVRSAREKESEREGREGKESGRERAGGGRKRTNGEREVQRTKETCTPEFSRDYARGLCIAGAHRTGEGGRGARRPTRKGSTTSTPRVEVTGVRSHRT